jgi:hypothetical protein
VTRSAGLFLREGAPAIAVGPDDEPVVVYTHGSTSHPEATMMLARRVAGAGCADGGWTCSRVERHDGGFTGFPGVAVTSTGRIAIAYFTTDNRVRIARAVPGADPSGGCGSGFRCQTLASTDPAAPYPRATLTVGPHDRVWAAFLERDDATQSDFVTVAYSDARGDGCEAGGWTCERVDVWNDSFALNDASVAFDATGHAYVAYPDSTFQVLRVAKRGRGTHTCAPGTTAGWRCKTVDSDPGGLVGRSPAIARTGTTMSVSYEDDGQQEQLRVASL